MSPIQKLEHRVIAIAFIFTLMENLRNYLFQRYTGVMLKKIDGKFKAFNEYIKINPELEKRLQQKNLQYENSPNRIVLLEILKWKNEEIKDDSLTNILKFIEDLEREKETSNYGKISLSDLRNNGPLAHGTKGISEQLLKEIYPPYGKDGLFNDTKTFLIKICDFKGEWHNPYDMINQKIIELMEQQ
ncbi:MAG: hypothetical protein AB1422_05370 [bacterium]